VRSSPATSERWVKSPTSFYSRVAATRAADDDTTRQYARFLSLKLFGTHSLRRTKATLLYRRTGNLRAVQLLLGHTKIESTVRYLGVEVDDALAIAAQLRSDVRGQSGHALPACCERVCAISGCEQSQQNLHLFDHLVGKQ
jgi:integrase